MNSAKTNLTIIGVGNGGTNIIKWLSSQPVYKTYKKGTLDLYATDTDGSKLQTAFAGIKGVTLIRLNNQEDQAFGTGADISLGRKFATEKTKTFEDIATGLAEKHGELLLVACLGGGSTGSLPVIAEIFLKKKIRVVALVAMPEVYQGAGRMNNARTVLIELQKFGVKVIVTHNDRETFDGTPREIYNMINTQSLGPILLVLREIYQTAASEVNGDTNDMHRVLKSLSYIGFCKCDPGSEEWDEKKVVETLLSHPLQDGRKIVSQSTSCLLWIHGPFLGSQIRKINLAIKKQMPQLKNDSTGEEVFGIKPCIDEYDGEKKIGAMYGWIAILAGVEVFPSEKSSTSSQLVLEAREPQKLLLDPNGEEPTGSADADTPDPVPEEEENTVPAEPEAVVEVADTDANLLMVDNRDKTDIKKVKVPAALAIRLKEASALGAKLPTDTALELREAFQPWLEQAIQIDSNLKGWQLFFCNNKVSFGPPLPFAQNGNFGAPQQQEQQ